MQAREKRWKWRDIAKKQNKKGRIIDKKQKMRAKIGRRKKQLLEIAEFTGIKSKI